MAKIYEYLIISFMFSIIVCFDIWRIYKLRHLINPWEYLEKSYKNEHLK